MQTNKKTVKQNKDKKTAKSKQTNKHLNTKQTMQNIEKIYKQIKLIIVVFCF